MCLNWQRTTYLKSLQDSSLPHKNEWDKRLSSLLFNFPKIRWLTSVNLWSYIASRVPALSGTMDYTKVYLGTF